MDVKLSTVGKDTAIEMAVEFTVKVQLSPYVEAYRQPNNGFWRGAVT